MALANRLAGQIIDKMDGVSAHWSHSVASRLAPVKEFRYVTLCNNPIAMKRLSQALPPLRYPLMGDRVIADAMRNRLDTALTCIRIEGQT